MQTIGPSACGAVTEATRRCARRSPKSWKSSRSAADQSPQSKAVPRTKLLRLRRPGQTVSFAQFEREVIGERIRDKIAASKMICPERPAAVDGEDRRSEPRVGCRPVAKCGPPVWALCCTLHGPSRPRSGGLLILAT